MMIGQAAAFVEYSAPPLPGRLGSREEAAAFEAIAEAWFELLAEGGDAADLAAGPGSSLSAPLLDLLAGAQGSHGAVASHTPWPLQEPSPPSASSRGSPCSADAAGGCAVTAAAAMDAVGHGDASTRLCREDWLSMMRSCREACGANLFLRKALTAIDPRGSCSLLGKMVSNLRHESDVETSPQLQRRRMQRRKPAAEGAILMLLGSAKQLARAEDSIGDLASFVSKALPDGEAISAHVLLEADFLPAPLPPIASEAAVQDAEHGDALEAPPPPPPAPPGDHVSSDDASTVAEAQRFVSAAPPTPPVALSEAPPAPPTEEHLAKAKAGAAEASEAEPCPPPPPGGEEDDYLSRQRIGADLKFGLLRESIVPPDSEGTGMCCICFEAMDASNLRHCGRPSCGKAAYCLGCLKIHAQTVVEDGLYAVPAVRCPSCNQRVATEAWSYLVDEKCFSKYHRNAQALLTYRCAACDETSSYFSSSLSVHSKDPFYALEADARKRVAEGWSSYFLGESTAEEFLQVLLDEHGCGHRKGGSPPAKMAKVVGASGGAVWIADLERRLALQLAFMHRYPRQRTPCCGERFCFKCKISSWHRGTSCRERLQSEKARQAQLCPGCGVPTQRSEGCSKITCVCGHIWDWDGDDSSVEGGFSEDGSEEDETTRPQTVMNLVAMNISASRENLNEALRSLVEAKAALNPPSDDEREGAQSPLLMAVQYRNANAVELLLEQGAKVTSDVLEEVKLISSESVRSRLEDLFRPQVQGDPNMKLPFWVWVQAGCVPAVEALLRNAAHEEEVREDVVIALRRCRGSDESKGRIEELVKEHVGDEDFRKLEVSSATTRLVQELRQALNEERSIDVSTVKHAISLGADANAREDADERGDMDDDDESESLGLSCLGLVATNAWASAESVESSIEALLAAQADVNAEAEEALTPLVAAVRHRNMPAIGALCRGAAALKFPSDVFDEVKTLSQPSRRRQVEDTLRPLVQAGSGPGPNALPLWFHVQVGDVARVKSHMELLEQLAAKGATSDAEQVDTDVFVALQRSRASAEERQEMATRFRRHLGDETFERHQGGAATRRLLAELREAYDDKREACVELIREALALKADPNAQEDDPEGHFNTWDEAAPLSHALDWTPLQLVVTNTYMSSSAMREAVRALVDAKADVDLENTDSPLMSALQHRSCDGVEALCEHDVKVTQEAFEEMKSISGMSARTRIEAALQPLIDRDKTLRCPLWIWVQAGASTYVEALLRNASHDEDIDVDVIVALQRCRGGEAVQSQISAHLRDYVGDEDEFARLSSLAATRRLLQELREAQGEERDIDMTVLYDTLALKADPNAREESLDDDEDEDADMDDEEAEEEEDEEDDENEANDDDEDGDGTAASGASSDDGEKNEEPDEEPDD
eukprot:TRINITY_DN110764_c0_g1_i1.p1 TRINITY_DN110764_c0_g1~~TRINITY_DN110764_c0_g1_i1.p1  ORF type:complete len:1400 (-),score=415.85 TRINITY_DN110764_c0_g1_i1:154-4353(-)